MRHVFVDPQSLEKKAIPEGIRDALAQLLVEQEAPAPDA
jgi:hypothetical protein